MSVTHMSSRVRDGVGLSPSSALCPFGTLTSCVRIARVDLAFDLGVGPLLASGVHSTTSHDATSGSEV